MQNFDVLQIDITPESSANNQTVKLLYFCGYIYSKYLIYLHIE